MKRLYENSAGCESAQWEPLVLPRSAHTRTIQHLGQRTATVREFNRWLSAEPVFTPSSLIACGRLGLLFVLFPQRRIPFLPVCRRAAGCVVESGSRAVPSSVEEVPVRRAERCGVLVVVPKRPSIYKDADGKCLETEMTRFVKRRLNSCPIFARRGKCRTNTAWILSTISETSPGHDTRIQVRKPRARLV